jgi:hypothetical protein
MKFKQNKIAERCTKLVKFRSTAHVNPNVYLGGRINAKRQWAVHVSGDHFSQHVNFRDPTHQQHDP